MLTEHLKEEKNKGYSVIETTIAYLLIQAFLLMLISNLPWPIVGYETWGGHIRGRRTPDPVWALFWAQLAIGFLLPVTGKTFLLAQYLIFAMAFLLLGKVEGTSRYGTAVASSMMYTVYWFQFFATALGLICWRYRKSQDSTWTPLIAYLAIQLAIVWGVAPFRLSFGANAGNWILLAFVIQCIGLLFAPSRIRIIVAAEILLGVMMANLPRWLLSSGNGSPDLLHDALWIVYLLQCAGISYWLMSRPETAGPVEGTCETNLIDRDSEVRNYT